MHIKGDNIMQIKPVNCSGSFLNKTKLSNNSNISAVSFSGVKRPLIAINAEDFKTETAKKLFKSIRTYCQPVKNGGSISDIKILNENLKFYNHNTIEEFTTSVDTLMTIKNDGEKGLLRLSRMYPNKVKQCILEAHLDKNGQMVRGTYKYGNMQFERDKNNVRRLKINNKTRLPHGENDREWGVTTDNLPIFQQFNDNSSRGMLEIFIELARLYTTLFK